VIKYGATFYLEQHKGPQSMTRIFIASIATLSTLAMPVYAQDSIRFLKAGSGLGQLGQVAAEPVEPATRNNFGFANVRPVTSQSEQSAPKLQAPPKRRIVQLKRAYSY
jgi:hypothetical protein